MKSLWKAILMAIVLFGYGYFLSTAGHDHSGHQKSIKEYQKIESADFDHAHH